MIPARSSLISLTVSKSSAARVLPLALAGAEAPALSPAPRAAAWPR
jgi:hypothetical protein